MSRLWLTIGLLTASAPLIGPAAAFPIGDPDMLARLDPRWAIAHGCFATGEAKAVAGAGRPMPLVSGLAPIHYPVRAATAQAQRYFDQGLAFLYGFEFEKAERSFAHGREVDGGCSMCLWGQALAMGPYINSGPVGAERIAAARKLTQQALAANNLTPIERGLVTALDQRYAPGAPKKDALGVWSIRFAEDMARLSADNPADDFIMVLAAESAMGVRPWDYWEKDGVRPLPWGARAIRLVETVLARNPDQPEAQHLYIHLTEASANPRRAEHFADLLERTAPASAHLIHMPGHTYYRIGRFDDSVKVNELAIKVDDAMADRLGEAKPFYGYFRHHSHFLTSAAEQMGDAATARRGAAQLEASVTPEKLAKAPYLQQMLLTALQARGQFATTEDLLAMPAPDKAMPVLRQFWFAQRAEARGRDGDRRGAMRDLAAMRAERARLRIPAEVRPVIVLAEQVALARIDYGQKNWRDALRHYRKAARIEATFTYNEPPVWHPPIEAAIGATLLKAGDAAGAKQAFDQALVRRPGNAWALWGRAQAEAALGDSTTEQRTLAALGKAWKGDRRWLSLERL